MIIIAHRGASSLAPENLRSALLKALESRADTIEVDLQLTRDNQWVLSHHREISLNSDGRGELSKMTLAELRSLDFGSWFGADFQGEKILTLREAFEILPHEVPLILDIKSQQGPAVIPDLVSEIPRERWKSDILSSFSISFIREGLLRYPDLKWALIMKKAPLWHLFRVRNLKLYSIHPAYHLVEPRLVEAIHRGGRMVFTWTVNAWEEMQCCEELGVDGIFTDFPQRAYQLRRALIGSGKQKISR